MGGSTRRSTSPNFSLHKFAMTLCFIGFQLLKKSLPVTLNLL
jgi:hypothetical protein